MTKYLLLLFALSRAAFGAGALAPTFDAKIGQLPPLSLADEYKFKLPRPFSFSDWSERRGFTAIVKKAPVAQPSYYSRMPIHPPDSSVDQNMPAKTPDPAVDFKLTVKSPDVESRT